MKMLNVACGSRYHKNWVNIDFYPVSKDVKKVNILNGLPFERNTFDVVYSSHFLEHLTKDKAEFFLKECYRVLKPEGIIRLVVPDLENMAREYLRILEEVKLDRSKEQYYEWITIELLDQLVRNKSGGQMLSMFNQIVQEKNIHLAEYVKFRTGDDVINLSELKKMNKVDKLKKINIHKLKNKVFTYYLNFIKFLVPSSIREYIFLDTAVGERHLWMYDSFSITRALEKTNFRDIKFLSYNQSQIPDFNEYNLDINPDGTPYKGHSSIYVEAIK